EHPERPVVPGQPPQPQEIKDLVRDFQANRQAFQKQQEALSRQLQKASDADRAIIRAQLKENLSIWMEQQKAQIQELKAQAKKMKDKVPILQKPIDSGAGEGRGR